MPLLRKAILCTLAYADIFDYPLSASETSRFLIAKKKTGLDNVQKTLSQMSADGEQINAEKGFYYLKGRRELVALRKKRGRWSQKKLKITQRVVNWLRLISTIKMIAVTGALATHNSQEDDDLDLLIVTTKNRLWLTRLLTVLLIEVVASRRRPQEKKLKDKVCLNMFLDEEHLVLPRKERDLFSAHEVCQIKVLWEKDGIYQKFLKENQWVKQYLPDALREIKKSRNEVIKGGEEKNYLTTPLLNYFERVAKKFQLWYMRNRRTTEKISEGIVRFHPQDARSWVLPEYQKRLKKLGIE